MALPPILQALYDKVRAYNSGPFSQATNPKGLARGGHLQGVFDAFIDDFTRFGREIAEGSVSATENARLTAEDAANTKKDRIASAQSVIAAAGEVVKAKDEADRAGRSAASVNLPPIIQDDAGKSLIVKPDGSGYLLGFVRPDPLFPIELTSPTANQADIGANGGQHTFVARAVGYAGDPTGYYSLYGFPLRSRRVNIYQASAPSVVFRTAVSNSPGRGLAVNLQTLGLANSTNYLAELVDTDGMGNEVRSAKVPFRTATNWVLAAGDAYGGGFYAGQIMQGGTTFNLVVSPKAEGENGALSWGLNQALGGSRIDGPSQSPVNSAWPAGSFCRGVRAGGFSDWYLPAVDELEVIYRNLKPSTTNNVTTSGVNENSVPARTSNYTAADPARTSVAAFLSGGGEAVPAGPVWSSTQVDAATAIFVNFSTGQQSTRAKDQTAAVRAARRVAV